MPPRRDRIVLWAFAGLVLAGMVADPTGLLYLAPALVLALPLLLGRFPGEHRLSGLARPPRTPSARALTSIPAPRSHVRVMQRGGRLVASALAKRPPPPPARRLVTT